MEFLDEHDVVARTSTRPPVSVIRVLLSGIGTSYLKR
jgi:hypothetical protein